MIKTVALVAGREIREKLRDRAFLIFTAFMLLLPFLAGGIGALFGASTVTGGHGTYAVGLVGKEASLLGVVIRKQASKSDIEVSIEHPASSEEARRSVSHEKLDAAVEGDEILLPEGQPPFELLDILQTSAQRLAAAAAMREAGVPDGEIEGAVHVALEESPLRVRQAGGGGEGFGAEWAVSATALLLLFITVFTYGYWIANGVVEEKSSRVVEVVLSAIRPSHLLAGKVVGIGLLGLGQLALLVAIGSLGVLVIDVELPETALAASGAVLLWFVLGYAFYGSLFAIAGSLVSKQEDLQYSQLPIMIIILAGYGAAFLQISNPDSLVARTLAFVPPFTPMIMLVRIGLGEAGIVEVAIAVLVMVAATVVLVSLASRIYAGSVLRFGARTGLRDAWYSLRSGPKAGP